MLKECKQVLAARWKRATVAGIVGAVIFSVVWYVVQIEKVKKGQVQVAWGDLASGIIICALLMFLAVFAHYLADLYYALEVADIAKMLRALELLFAQLPRDFARGAEVVNLGAAPGHTLSVICEVCHAAAEALEKGIDYESKPLSRVQVADGLRRLVQDAKADTGLVASLLNQEGLRRYDTYLKQLEETAGRINPPPIVKS
ncbi:MAG: hypothetical protein HY233_07975 [Acidobacteriales bacterium]|nr:hypothetical protein [Terriglobales bacterium]